MITKSSPSFHVVGGAAIAQILAERPADCIADVQKTYLDHGNGMTTNPDSYFLRFPDAPRNRIIALPATLHADGGVSGIKWISSFPGNIDRGMQRASAVLVLNNAETGYPFALLEASRISSARTAASAVLGAYWLSGRLRRAGRIAFVGGGVIARSVLDMFVADGWTVGAWDLREPDSGSAQGFADHAWASHGLTVRSVGIDDALTADIVVLATTAPAPYILDHAFRPGQCVLNISLRDLSPEIIAAANNVLDDVEHCLKADTSPDLAVRKFGRRDFINGTLAEIMAGTADLDPDKPTIFSPFGLGVLDLALGQRVFNEAVRRGTAQRIDDFLFEMER